MCHARWREQVASFSAALLFEQTIGDVLVQVRCYSQASANLSRLSNQWSYDGACTVISNAERQARRGAKREAEIEALRAAIIKAELARAQAENHLLRQRILDLETALALRQSAAQSAQLQAASEVAHHKEKNKELQFKLRHMWDWYNDEITKAGGLTFKASSLIAKALHPDATPSEQVRLEAFKAFSAWKSDRDAAKRH